MALGATSCDSELARRSLAGSRPAFVVEAISPADGELGVIRDGIVEIVVSAPLNRSSFGNDLDRLADFVLIERVDPSGNVLVAGEISLRDGDTRIVFRPLENWEVPLMAYRISILPGLTNLDDEPLDLDGSSVPLPSSFVTEDFQDLVPPVFDGIVALDVISSSALRATWDPASDDFSSANEITYRVYVNDPPGGQLDVDYGAPIVETAPNVLVFFVSGLEQDTEYTVGVRAVDSFGNESQNLETLAARTEAIPDVDPPTFTGVAEVVSTSPDTILARWSSAADDRDDAVDIRYRIFIDTSPALDFSLPIATTPAGETEVFVTGLDSDTVYFVAVRSIDSSDNEDDNEVALDTRTLASFADDVFPIFASPALGGCIRSFCHARGNSGGGLSLESYNDLITGGRNPAPRTIVPGDPTGSYIMWRTDASNPNFVRNRSRMPVGRPPLDEAILAVLRRWIEQGAEDN